MIKEYINELINENNDELLRYERQMSTLFEDLESSKKFLEVLQKEKDADKNIFSPRTIDMNIRNKIDEVKRNIDKTQQDIEYTRSFIETHSKKKDEYEKLLLELNKLDLDQTSVPQQTDTENQADQAETEKPEVTKEEQLELLKKEEYESSRVSAEFLSDLYRSTELCLALLNGDRNKCRKELINLKTLIKKEASRLKLKSYV